MRPRDVFPGGALLLVTGCVLSDGDTRHADILPLAVGNTWTYVDSAYYGGDSIVVSALENAVTGTRAVTLEGAAETVFVSRSRVNGGTPSPLRSYLKNYGHSNYVLGVEEDTARYVRKFLHIEYPTRKGRRYPNYFFSFADSAGFRVAVVETVEVEVVDPRYACTVPAGTFSCVKFRVYHPDGSVHVTAYYAPGVGALGYESTRRLMVGDSLRDVVFTRRLTSYTLH